jgi:hypothetical protein
MPLLRQSIAAATMLGAAACVSQPAPMPADMDIDFIRGCWVQKEAPGGRVQAFLRLLPDGDSLSGQIADVSTGDWITVASLSFARAGERAIFDARDMPELPAHTRIDPSRLAASFEWARPESGRQLAAYAGPAPSRTFLFAEGGADTLAIRAVSADPDATLVFTLFDGERDGCD